MSLLSRLRPTRPAAGPTEPVIVEFAFCEPVSATATSPWHIRRVGPEGLKLGGGIPTPPLCGRESVIRGWDLTSAVTAESVRLGSTPREGDGRVFLCRACTDAYNALDAS
jgi:hypothetical protein